MNSRRYLQLPPLTGAPIVAIGRHSNAHTSFPCVPLPLSQSTVFSPGKEAKREYGKMVSLDISHESERKGEGVSEKVKEKRWSALHTVCII